MTLDSPDALNTPTIFNRRQLMLGAGALSLLSVSGRAFAQAASALPDGPFTLPKRAYEANALEPHIDAMTMDIHYARHHQAYVNGLNAALKDHGELAKLPLPELLGKIAEVPDTIRTAVRNMGGGHANHTMFWEVMGPTPGAPSSDLKAAIDADLGGMEKMQEMFNSAGTRVFGSGWAFISVTREGKLAIAARPNQDTLLMDKQMVLIGNDVWEHAYYLKYQNRRADYLKAWWNVVDWSKVSARYAAAKAGTLGV